MKTHGLSWGKDRHPLYSLWSAMRTRCRNTHVKAYKNYGGRGIKIAKQWDSFLEFYKWALKAGWKKGLVIDRKNNNGNYTPKNCRYVTRTVSARNRRGAIVNEFIVKQMRIRFKAGARPAVVAREFHVSLDISMKVRLFKTWKEIKP